MSSVTYPLPGATINDKYEEYLIQIDNLKSDLWEHYKCVGTYWKIITEGNTYLSCIPNDILKLIRQYIPGYVWTYFEDDGVGCIYCPECGNLVAVSASYTWYGSNTIFECTPCNYKFKLGKYINPYIHELIPIE